MTSSATRTTSIAVFCGARSGNDPKFKAAAEQTGRLIAGRGWRVVYGGGNVGLMGALANGALAAGGQVLGIIPHKLLERELAHKGIQEMDVVPDMATRKERMITASDAFLSLPGGLGTLDEMFEVLTLRQIGYHQKPSALVDLDGYFSGLVQALRGFQGHGLIDAVELDRLLIAATPEDALERLAAVLKSGAYVGSGS